MTSPLRQKLAQFALALKTRLRRPPASGKKRSLRRIALYVGMGLIALITAVFVTFPYEALGKRLTAEAASAGYLLRIGSIGPGFFSVRAKRIELVAKATGTSEPKPLRIALLSIRPSLFPLGVHATIHALGGTAEAAVGGLSSLRVVADLRRIDFASGDFESFTGVKARGTLDGELDMTIPKVKPPGGGTALPDTSAASGTLTLKGNGLQVLGGTMSIAIPVFGPEPVPLDLPQLAFGTLDVRLNAKAGAVTITSFTSASSDLEVQVTGTAKLGQRIAYSELDCGVRFHLTKEAKERLGMLSAVTNLIPVDPKDSEWNAGRLTGYLGQPQFR